jgi:hypothetical protein
MTKISVLLAHFKTWEWTAICIYHLKKYGFSGVPYEILVVDNSPGHPSIRAITETELGEDVKVINGNPDFSSHGNGYDLAAQQASGDYFFTTETDAFPVRHGWFEEYVKAIGDGYDLIGPEIPQSAGRYIHPAGALMARKVYDKALEWMKAHDDWFFCPGGAVAAGLSDRPYHVVARMCDMPKGDEFTRALVLWAQSGPYQEMRSFDEDTFENYGQRIGIQNFDPVEGKRHYLKIGYEAGQWLAYFAEAHGFRVLRAPVEIVWVDGWENRQAKHSTVFGGFTHVWGGTVSDDPNYDSHCRDVKKYQMREHFNTLPEKLQKQIVSLQFDAHDLKSQA